MQQKIHNVFSNFLLLTVDVSPQMGLELQTYFNSTAVAPSNTPQNHLHRVCYFVAPKQVQGAGSLVHTGGNVLGSYKKQVCLLPSVAGRSPVGKG